MWCARRVATPFWSRRSLTRYAPATICASQPRKLCAVTSPAVRDLVKAGSVLGDETALSDAVRLAGLDPHRGRVAAEELVLGQLLRSADPIMFTHRIVRTAIHGLLEPVERLTLHKDAAKLLAANGAQPELTAEHVLLMGPTHDTWAVGVLHEA